MYRDVERVAKSVYRCSLVEPSVHPLMKLSRLSGRATKMMLNSLGYDGSEFCVRADSDLTAGVIISAIVTSVYLDTRRRGMDVSALCYEDLVARPLDVCRVVLEFCRLSVSLAELAVEAFDDDSQANSGIAKSVVGRFEEPEMTVEIKAKLDELLKKRGMPTIGELGVIEGTLTCS